MPNNQYLKASSDLDRCHGNVCPISPNGHHQVPNETIIDIAEISDFGVFKVVDFANFITTENKVIWSRWN